MRNLIIGLSLLVLSGTARAEPLKRDLGHGLVYLRKLVLPDDLSLKTAAPACVLDLRYTTSNGDTADALNVWLNQHTAGPRLVFVLLNDATAPDVRAELASRPARPGLLTLGPKLPEYTPDIVVSVDPQEEQRAYAAFPESKDPASLLMPTANKTRYDEAAIVKAMNEGMPVPDTEPMPDLDDAKRGQPPSSPPLIDRTLQRAVQIHRAWQVLASP